MKKFLLLLMILSVSFVAKSQVVSEKVSIPVSVEVNKDPAQIIFNWPLDANAASYYIYRKEVDDDSWGPVHELLSGTAVQYIDNEVDAGIAYEYKFYRTSSVSNAYSYIYACIDCPPVDYRGAVILLVDNAYSVSLKNEIDRLIIDLTGDGWRVLRHDINRNSSVTDVKGIIQSDYNTDPDVRTVFILGHVPVPYSGLLTIPPDGHVVGSGSHTGAWAADVYYGELDGTWTDLYYDTSATREWNVNIPGDGKFDQSNIPSEVELEVGRVDLYNMPQFSTNDTDLIRKYLDKNHNFRIGEITAERRGLIDDNFNSYNLTAAGYRNFPAMFGPGKTFDNSDGKDYFTSMKNESYLWSCGSGAGSFTSCNGLKKGRAYTKDFASDTVRTIFTMLTGSYFADWDTENNFLRAPLASYPSALVSFWGNIPQWHLHHMALGENIGYCTKLTQNNSNLYYNGNFNGSARRIHIALMGDPTLKMFIVGAPSNLKADSIANVTVKLTWNASTDSVLGYNIYRSDNLYNKFNKVNSQIITDTFFTHSKSDNGNNVYMVRAVKLETTGSGTFYNLSQGIIDSASTLWPVGINTPAIQKPSLKCYPNPTNGVLNIEFESEKQSGSTLLITDVMGKKIKEITIDDHQGKTKLNVDLKSYPKGIYIIKVRDGNNTLRSKVFYQ